MCFFTLHQLRNYSDVLKQYVCSNSVRSRAHLCETFSSFVPLWYRLVVLFYDVPRANSGHTAAQQGLFTEGLVGLSGSLPAGCQQRSVVGHRRAQINPPLSTGMMGRLMGAVRADRLTRFRTPLCPFSYLPDGGPIQAGISHPIDNVASVSCRSGTHPVFRPFLVFLSVSIPTYFNPSRGSGPVGC